jgi:hypothetical protein
VKLDDGLQISMSSPYGPMDKAPAYGAGDSGFESQYGLIFFSPVSSAGLMQFSPYQKKVLRARIELATFCV